MLCSFGERGRAGAFSSVAAVHVVLFVCKVATCLFSEVELSNSSCFSTFFFCPFLAIHYLLSICFFLSYYFSCPFVFPLSPLATLAVILNRCCSVEMMTHTQPLWFHMNRFRLQQKLHWSSLPLFFFHFCHDASRHFVSLYSSHTVSFSHIHCVFSFSLLLTKPWDCTVSIHTFNATVCVSLCIPP